MIASSRPVKNVLVHGAVIRAKPSRSTEPGVRKLLANYQTGFGYKPMPKQPDWRFAHAFISVRFVVKRYTLQQNCL